MSVVRPGRLLLVALAGLLVFAWFALAQPSRAYQEGALITIAPPLTQPAVGEPFTTTVSIANGNAVLGFQFDVNFDPAVLSVETIDLGPYIGNTGRAPQPLGPDVRAAAEGRVVFGGFTIGQQPGASGDGTLATITWNALKAGTSTVTLTKQQLAGSGGTPLASEVDDGITVTVGGSAGGGSNSFALLAAVGAIAMLGVGAFLFSRRPRTA